jgi:drug/metabolite transporter (DMT)-like permease
MNRGLLLALGAAAISGVSVFVNSYGVKAFGDATTYTTAKNTVAAVLLLAVCGLAQAGGRGMVAVPARRSRLLGLAAIAVVGGSVPFVLFFEGLAQATSGPAQAQFINKTLVIWVALLAVSVLGERLGALQLGAVALLVVGQAVLSGGLGTAFSPHLGRGEAMIFAATLLWAVEVVLAKVLLRDLSSWTLALGRMGLGSALLIGWVLVTGRGAQLAGMDAAQWRWVLLTGLLLAAYVATWLAALALAPAVNVTAMLVAAVPVTAVLQAVVQHTSLPLNGLSLVVAGCALVIAATLSRRRVPVSA